MRIIQNLKPAILLDICDKAYEETLQLQSKVHKLRESNDIFDTIILVEHLPTITIGKAGGYQYFKVPPEELEKRGIDIVDVDRGGSITFHGPGQLVVYPIINLKAHHLDSIQYLRKLEQILIDTLFDYGIKANRFKPYTGVWVDKEKIAAIGVSCRNNITMHGMAININTDLSYFSFITPCGIDDYSVTSVAELLGSNVNMEHFKQNICKKLSNHFQIFFMEAEY